MRSSKEMTSTAFGPPFDDADADTILRSSDQVDFYVYRVILSKSSPFFKTMFSLPQPDVASVSEKQIPVISLTENSKTIAVLLTPIYPVVPSLTTKHASLDDMIDTFVAARKYDMAVVSQHLVQKFAESKVVKDSPVEAFCAVYSHGLGEAARVAARASLKHRMTLDDIGDKLRHTNGPALHQLWKFHRACSATAAEAVSNNCLTWITPSHRSWWAFVEMPPSCACRKVFYEVGPSGSTDWYATASWHNYITRARDVLLEQPCREAVTHDALPKLSDEEKSCQGCKRTLFGLPEFIRLLGEEVERRVLKVDIELPS